MGLNEPLRCWPKMTWAGMNSTCGHCSTHCAAIGSLSSSRFRKSWKIGLLVSQVESGWVVPINIKADVTIGIKQE
jgi:hypothetical protein